jgi:hypothetical protein
MRSLLSRRLVLGLIVALVVLAVATASAQGPAGSGWWTGFTIQNTSAGNSINVAVEAYTRSGAGDPAETPLAVVEVPDTFAVTFTPGLAGNCGAVATNGCRIAFTPDLPAPFEGSAVISSDGPAVAIAQVNNNPVGSAGVTGGTARGGYQGTGDGIASNTLYFPTVKNNFSGQTTALFVQAAGAEANVSIQYKLNNGQIKNANTVIEANKTYVFMPGAAGVPSCGGGVNDSCIGGAVVTSSSGPIAGTVVEYLEGVAIARFVLSTRALVPGDAGEVILAPTMKNNFNGGTTGASVFNTNDASTATVDLRFTVTGVTSGCSAKVGDVATDQITVPPLGSTVVSVHRGNIGGLPACTFFAMTASTADHGGQHIAVTVNENRVIGGDSLKAVYTGFSAASATSTVFFPLVKENFSNNTTGLALVNASPTTATAFILTYSGSSGTHVLETISVAPGAAVSVRQAFAGSPNWTAISGGLPQAGVRYAVSVVPKVPGVPIVGLAQEATVSGTRLDVYNLEGFNQ